VDAIQNVVCGPELSTATRACRLDTLQDLKCIQSACSGRRLTACGLYKQVRQVVDLDGFYTLASEYLECGKCNKKYISWSDAILDQLDVGHRSQFPAILTYKYVLVYLI